MCKCHQLLNLPSQLFPCALVNMHLGYGWCYTCLDGCSNQENAPSQLWNIQNILQLWHVPSVIDLHQHLNISHSDNLKFGILNSMDHCLILFVQWQCLNLHVPYSIMCWVDPISKIHTFLYFCLIDLIPTIMAWMFDHSFAWLSFISFVIIQSPPSRNF